MKGKKGFEAGNEYRYTKDSPNQPRMTIKKFTKTVERLLGANAEEIERIIYDSTTPMAVRKIAEKINNGELSEVLQLCREES